LKFTEPLDKDIPNTTNGDKEWCFFEFKDDMIVNDGADPLLLNQPNKSAYLFGLDDQVCDFVLQNPTISAQHCVIQFRQRFETRELDWEEQRAKGDFQTV
jgi:hypothetical protein